MALKINMTGFIGKKLLVAPLDWGLGHTTRCIPVIRALLSHQCEIYLAGNRVQEKILREEFPDLTFLPLEGYNITYSRSFTGLKLILQIPAVLKSIKKENRWLDLQVKKYHFDAVISDNRYGLYHPDVFSVLITHQLWIKSPFGKWNESILQDWNYKLINRFNECWVPDEEGENNLAGDLSHPEKMPAVPVKYIGPQSRFIMKDGVEIKDNLLIILSGPEPQRTILEKKILNQVDDYNGVVTIIRGLPADENTISSNEKISFYNHLPANALNEEANKAEFIICRSGYSSIMDIACLRKKSILIPTPGQTEQQYLAGYLFQKKFALSFDQAEFSLLKSLEAARKFEYRI